MGMVFAADSTPDTGFNSWMLVLTTITIFAIVSGPILAVQIDKWISRADSVRQRKSLVFETLMTTRATMASLDHIRALNMIDLAWYGKPTKHGPRRSPSEEEVISAWRAYLSHLGAPLPEQPTPVTDTAWSARRNALLVDLLIAMATDLHYRFDRNQIETSVYAPRLHSIIENELAILRQAAIRVLTGENVLKTALAPLNPQAAAIGEEFISNLIRVLKAEQPIRMTVERPDNS